MSASLVIHRAGAEAIDDVMSIMAEAFDPQYGETWTRAQVMGMLLLPGVSLIIATIDTLSVGYALFRAMADEAELLLIAVRPSYRGKEVGSQLMIEMTSLVKQAGAKKMYLEVREANPAIQLYLKHGFIAIGRRFDYYHGKNGDSADAVTMCVDVGQ